VRRLGDLAHRYPDKSYFVNDVPTTRSGNTMHWVIKAKALGQALGDISIMENPGALDEIPIIVK
jgi:acetyl-CoA synthetase